MAINVNDVRLLGQNKRVKKIRVSMDHVLTLRFIVEAVFTNNVAKNLNPSSSSSSSKASTFAPTERDGQRTGVGVTDDNRGEDTRPPMIHTTYVEHCVAHPRSVDIACCTPSFRPTRHTVRVIGSFESYTDEGVVRTSGKRSEYSRKAL